MGKILEDGSPQNHAVDMKAHKPSRMACDAQPHDLKVKLGRVIYSI